jgi:hypothetical protein
MSKNLADGAVVLSHEWRILRVDEERRGNSLPSI